MAVEAAQAVEPAAALVELDQVAEPAAALAELDRVELELAPVEAGEAAPAARVENHKS